MHPAKLAGQLRYAVLMPSRDRCATEMGQHFLTEEFNRTQHFPLWQARETKGAKDMLKAGCLDLLQTLDHDLWRAP